MVLGFPVLGVPVLLVSFHGRLFPDNPLPTESSSQFHLSGSLISMPLHPLSCQFLDFGYLELPYLFWQSMPYQHKHLCHLVIFKTYRTCRLKNILDGF